MRVLFDPAVQRLRKDGVLQEAGRHAEAEEGIVTRDRKGFLKAGLRVYTPDEMLR